MELVCRSLYSPRDFNVGALIRESWAPYEAEGMHEQARWGGAHPGLGSDEPS